MTVAARLWKRVERTPGCWLWTGYRRTTGYGRIGFRGRIDYAHRVAWVVAKGEIPDGMCVLHKCDNPACVRPAHLWLGTQRENMIDKGRKGRSRNQFMEPRLA